MDQRNLSEKVLSFGHLFAAIAQDREKKTPIAQMYFGDFRLHPSLFREDDQFREGIKTPTQGAMLPAYARVMGEIHSELRFKLFPFMQIRFDTERLKPATRKVLKDIDQLLEDWQRAVKETEGKTDIPARYDFRCPGSQAIHCLILINYRLRHITHLKKNPKL